jgi:hypothetical protein
MRGMEAPTSSRRSARSRSSPTIWSAFSKAQSARTSEPLPVPF